MTVQEKFERIQNLIGRLEDINKRPLKYALSDLIEVLDKDVSEMSRLLDDIEYDIKDAVVTRYTSEEVYKQLELNAELDIVL